MTFDCLTLKRERVMLFCAVAQFSFGLGPDLLACLLEYPSSLTFLLLLLLLAHNHTHNASVLVGWT